MSTCGRTSALCTVIRGLMTEAPVPLRGRGPRVEGGCEAAQRQRIDMISPATMAPKPMAKFQAFRNAMNGICSPAT